MPRDSLSYEQQKSIDNMSEPEDDPSIVEDYLDLSNEIAERFGWPDWICDAFAYSVCNSDPDYLYRQVGKFVNPLIAEIDKERQEFQP